MLSIIMLADNLSDYSLFFPLHKNIKKAINNTVLVAKGNRFLKTRYFSSELLIQLPTLKLSIHLPQSTYPCPTSFEPHYSRSLGALV
ncbi:MAG: hypothetical protein GX587_13145 [Bacteroidales bacterium]|nr:hypothetical protein [Bacteroidales bacterium]